MARIKFNKAFGIASISGRIGDLIFYTKNGKTFVRSTKKQPDLRAIIEPFSNHSRTVNVSEPVLKTNNNNESND